MERKNSGIHLLSSSDELAVSGSGFFYDLGAFIAKTSNASDAIYAQYGNTARNNYW